MRKEITDPVLMRVLDKTNPLVALATGCKIGNGKIANVTCIFFSWAGGRLRELFCSPCSPGRRTASFSGTARHPHISEVYSRYSLCLAISGLVHLSMGSKNAPRQSRRVLQWNSRAIILPMASVCVFLLITRCRRTYIDELVYIPYIPADCKTCEKV